MKCALLYKFTLFIVLCFGSSVYFYHVYRKSQIRLVTSVPIRIIAQTGPEKEGLKTDYLAQLIGLSLDRKPSIIDEKSAERRLLSSPLIQRAQVKQVAPGILFIDYNMRKPYVLLGEFENVALDREGYPFPFAPFYTPKNMPCVYLGKTPIYWNVPVDKRQLAFEILEYLQEKIDLFKVKILDITHANHPLLGKKEVVIVIQNWGGQHTLRLLPTSYREALARYLLIPCEKGKQIIDLRLPELGFIKREDHD